MLRHDLAECWSKGSSGLSLLIFLTLCLLQPVFRVMGFSVTGRVLNGPNGQGVHRATVTLNNQIKGI